MDAFRNLARQRTAGAPRRTPSDWSPANGNTTRMSCETSEVSREQVDSGQTKEDRNIRLYDEGAARSGPPLSGYWLLPTDHYAVKSWQSSSNISMYWSQSSIECWTESVHSSSRPGVM